MIPIVLLVCLSYGAVLFFSYRSISDLSTRVGSEAAEIMHTMTESYCTEAERLAQSQSLNENLLSGNTDKAVYSELYDFVNGQKIRCEFFIYGPDFSCRYASTLSKPSPEENRSFFSRLSNVQAETLISFENTNDENCLFIGAAIGSKEARYGYILFDMPESVFSELTITREAVDILVANQYRQVLWSTNKKYVGRFGKAEKELVNGSGLIATNGITLYRTSSQIADGQLTIAVISDCTTYRNMLVILAIFLIAVMIITFLCLYFASGSIAKRKTASMDTFVTGIQGLKNGRFDKIHITSGDEFEDIANTYNRMLDDFQQLMKDNEEKAYLTVTSELKQLEAQFNPHFLFNTLEVIRYHLYLEPQKVEKAIVDLSDLLRYSLQEKEEVPLSEELRYTACYLNIQKIRLDDSFRCSLNIDENAYDCFVPKLLIQPIVENAFKYGYHGQKNYTLSLTALVDHNQLIVEVANNGPEITPDSLEEIRRNMCSNESRPRHFGLYGINKRLQLLYGTESGLSITSKAGRTVVTAVLPAKVKGEATDAENTDC